MSDEEIEAMAAQLEGAARVEDAKFRIVQHGGGADESHVVANRAGYLRMAATFLSAAIAPYPDQKFDAVELKEIEWMDENSDPLFSWFERHERSEGWTTADTSPHQRSWKETVWVYGCSLLGLILIGIFLTGLGVVWGTIFR